jgi:FMN phosphatase YigB (HAD superfamily)
MLTSNSQQRDNGNPCRTLFFDDRPNNVETARELGMEAHIFESAEQTREILSAGPPLEFDTKHLASS